MVLEPFPAPGALCCTPEGYRAVFKDHPEPILALNYDPSHYLRMGIDPVRLLREFVDRVYHVHAKDTEISQDALYEFGTEQPATLDKPVRYGGTFWRYTLPGFGSAPWHTLFSILASAGYPGRISIELEDYRFNGSEQGEQEGLQISGRYLASN